MIANDNLSSVCKEHMRKRIQPLKTASQLTVVVKCTNNTLHLISNICVQGEK